MGGKRNLARRIVSLIEATPHQLYAEPFVGMGGVFLRRTRAAPREVVNDASADIATLFRVLQRHYLAFIEMLRWHLTTRVEFDRLMRTDPATLTDLERAARFLYLQRTAFGGKVVGRNFGMRAPGRFDVTRLQPMLQDLHERLAGVVIERLDFADFIARYDEPAALFYCDPPYWGAEDYYGVELFSQADFNRLAERLARIRGRFLLSINDTPEVREIFGEFRLSPVSHHTGLQGGQQAYRELIVANFEPPVD